jgi:hypothetical protein
VYVFASCLEDKNRQKYVSEYYGEPGCGYCVQFIPTASTGRDSGEALTYASSARNWTLALIAALGFLIFPLFSRNP